MTLLGMTTGEQSYFGLTLPGGIISRCYKFVILSSFL